MCKTLLMYREKYWIKSQSNKLLFETNVTGLEEEGGMMEGISMQERRYDRDDEEKIMYILLSSLENLNNNNYLNIL